MLQELLLFAQKEDINKWLDEHPAVLGGLFMILGFGIAMYGVYELKTGVTRDKKGRVMEGSGATAVTYIRIIAGAIFGLFGTYKLLFG